MRGLRALDISEERGLAGRVAGALYLTGAVSILLVLLLPGTVTSHWEVVLVLSTVGAAWGMLCLTAVRWSSAPPIVSLVSSAAGFPITAVAMAATGGAHSPARFYLFFIVFYCSYFYAPRVAAPFLAGCMAVEGLPLLYDSHAIEIGYLGEVVLVSATYVVLGGLIMAGKQLLVSLREEAQNLSRRDSLTGLCNRRAFEERVAEHLGGGRASDRIGLLLLDLDGFKDVNTAYGFQAGDRVLVEIAGALELAVRNQDFVARLGGDEFAVIVAGAGLPSMRSLCERVLATVRLAEERIDLPDFSPRASVGWALYPDDAESAEDLLAAADLALRTAKAAGKDRGLAPADWLPEAAVRS
jgi:diguanylate cyclase (GGDEF)-like protein